MRKFATPQRLSMHLRYSMRRGNGGCMAQMAILGVEPLDEEAIKAVDGQARERARRLRARGLNPNYARERKQQCCGPIALKMYGPALAWAYGEEDR
eukprot:TRINITY_DN48160_c0_g2_i1.p1 TRINITY_DN48160_c0_g2~~TRINITY_DN48160_c0_g2_i1.p1  ORF type:complete len:106 (+),score=21.22 TRINITY_DN48160_c0_g2_i1:31-318(+)